MNRSTLLAAGVLAVSALALTACSPGNTSDEEAPGPTTLVVASNNAALDAALHMGIEEGYFADEGLELELTLQPSPPQAISSLQGGGVDIIFTPTVPLLNAMSRSMPLVMVSPAFGYPEGSLSDAAERDDSGLVASLSSGIRDVAELEGRTIAVVARHGALEITATQVLKDAGVDPASIEWITLDFVSALEALSQGTVDAAVMVTPFRDRALEAGMPLLASPSAAFAEKGAFGVWATTDAILDSKSEAIAAFQRAMFRSHELANSSQQRAAEMIIEFTGMPLAPEEVSVPYWPLEIDLRDIERTAEKLVGLGVLEQNVDLSGALFSP